MPLNRGLVVDRHRLTGDVLESWFGHAPRSQCLTAGQTLFFFDPCSRRRLGNKYMITAWGEGLYKGARRLDDADRRSTKDKLWSWDFNTVRVLPPLESFEVPWNPGTPWVRWEEKDIINNCKAQHKMTRFTSKRKQLIPDAEAAPDATCSRVAAVAPAAA